MIDAIPTAAPPSSPPSAQSTQKAEKSDTDKGETSATDENAGAEFAAALDAAVQPLLPESASNDPAAAIAATQVQVVATADPALQPAVSGETVMPLPLPLASPGARSGALRPESRAAVQTASQLPAQHADRKNPETATETPVTDDAQPTARGTKLEADLPMVKPFEPLAERSASPAGDAQPTPAGLAADAVADAARRDRTPSLKLETHLPVHSPRFAEGFGQQITVLVHHGIQQAQLSLSPPDLGPVDIRITVANDEASVQIAAPTGVARDAIQDALPRLKEMLDQSGVKLNDAGVFAQLPQREQFNQSQQRTDWWMQEPEMKNPAETEQFRPVTATSVRAGLIDAYA